MTDIVETDGILGGKPRVEGTRVTAEQIYEMYAQAGMRPEEIADSLPTVTISGVRAAITYIEAHSDGTGQADAVA